MAEKEKTKGYEMDTTEELDDWFEDLKRNKTTEVSEPSSGIELPAKRNGAGKPDEMPEVSTDSFKEPDIEKELESNTHATIYETTDDQPYYKVDFPELSKIERGIMTQVREQSIDEIDIDPQNISNVRERQEIFRERVKEILEGKNLPESVSEEKLDDMSRIIVRDMIGFGMLDILLNDDDLEDILVTATDKPVYVFHRDYGMCVTNLKFENEEEIIHQIEKMGRYVGRRIDQQNPLLDATLPDGSRVNATIPPVSLDGPTLSIRKFRADPLTIIDILDYGTLTTEVAAFLWLSVEGFGIKPANILFAGGTACGKSTTMNAVSAFIPNRERIISIEDTAELHLPHEHWVRLETRPPNIEGEGEITMEDLVKNALRMRPDRIMVGEVRGPEAQTMFTGMNTGHDGCMGTVHSNSAKETVTRLVEKPMDVPEVMVPTLDMVVMQKRLHRREEGQARRVTEIAEVTGFENEQPQLSRIFSWNAKNDMLESTGVPSMTKKNIADFAGVSGGEVEKEIKRRATVLEWMRKEKIRDVYDLGRVVEAYYRNSETLIKKIEADVLDNEVYMED